MNQDLEVQRLQEKLKVSQDWVLRLQAQLRDALRLPRNESEELRHLIEEPKLAIPLVQAYDIKIAEKNEEISRLQRENNRLKKTNENVAVNGRDAFESGKMAEELASAAIATAEDDAAACRSEVIRLQHELSEVREKISSLAESESKARSLANNEVRKRESFELEVSDKRILVERLEADLQAERKKVSLLRAATDEEKNATETQKVQLHLVSKESDDKMHEIERLRNKMVSALKQATENHQTHMRLVEEKHRNAMGKLQEQLRTNDVTMMKLRAQLARAEVAGSSSGAQLSVTTSVLEAESRRGQEAELQRLYKELTVAQLERDDAKARYDQLQISRKGDLDERVRELRNDKESLTLRVRDMEERNHRLEKDLQGAKDRLRQSRDATHNAVHDTNALRVERDQLQRKFDEGTKLIVQLEDNLKKAVLEAEEAAGAEKYSTQKLERKLAESQKDEYAAQERLQQQVRTLETQLEEMRNMLRDTEVRTMQLQEASNDKDRTISNMSIRVERLNSGLTSHKKQLAVCDERLSQAANAEQVLKNDLRQLSLHCEQIRMENARLERERRRLEQIMK